MALANSVPRQNLHAFEDADIVALAQAGSEAAFREIMRRNNRRLFRVARAVVRDAGEAEDVLQEAYLKAFAGLASFRGEASLSTWLTRITLNEALQRRRRQREMIELRELDRPTASGTNVLVLPMSSETANPEAAAARAQLRGLLEQAVDELPASFRLVFMMRDIEEMSIEETAAHLRLRPETVRTRLFRARRLLRKALHARIASGFNDVFPFEGARCARITNAVIARLAEAPRPSDAEPRGHASQEEDNGFA
jgi:RNA polymerase sigma-70 factor, ECF subfamily